MKTVNNLYIIPSYTNFIENKDKIKDDIIKRWVNFGFMDGLSGSIMENLCYVFEDAAIKFLNNDENTILVKHLFEDFDKALSYETDSFPILRRINSNESIKLKKPFFIDDLSIFIKENEENIKNEMSHNLSNKTKKENLDIEGEYCALISDMIIKSIKNNI